MAPSRILRRRERIPIATASRRRLRAARWSVRCRSWVAVAGDRIACGRGACSGRCRMISVVEPATGQVMAEVEQADAAATDAAVARAKAAFPAWRAIAPGDRAAVLHKLADALAEKREE